MSLALHPGEILRTEIEARGLNPSIVGQGLGIDKGRVYHIIKGTRDITPDTALRLSRYFRTTPQFWLNLQNAYDLAQMEQNPQFAAALDAIEPYEEKEETAIQQPLILTAT